MNFRHSNSESVVNRFFAFPSSAQFVDLCKNSVDRVFFHFLRISAVEIFVFTKPLPPQSTAACKALDSSRGSGTSFLLNKDGEAVLITDDEIQQTVFIKIGYIDSPADSHFVIN